MNQSYLNRPSGGGAMTAEEYAAAYGQGAPSDCGSKPCPCDKTPDCKPDCPTQVVCCCQSIPVPCPTPVVEEGCCCKESFRAALQLLCDDELAFLLDFDTTAFVTDHYIAGAAVTETVPTTTPADNLVAPLAGSFRRFSPCSCDLLDVVAPLYTAPETLTGLTTTQVNLCELTAAVIQLAAVDAEGDLTAEEVAARNLRRVRRILSAGLNPCGTSCGKCNCSCSDCEDCCCAAGLLSALSESNLSRRVSLAAGPLLLSGVTLLGTVGNVLVLVNEDAQRFYFVCVNKIEFLA